MITRLLIDMINVFRVVFGKYPKRIILSFKIEKEFEKELLRLHIPYQKQFPIRTIAIVDFLLPDKIIVQCDGDYWHSLPQRKNKDINQDIILNFLGYKVYRFTETQINKSVKNCIKNIAQRRINQATTENLL